MSRCYTDVVYEGERCEREATYVATVDYTQTRMYLCNEHLAEWRALWPDSIIEMRSLSRDPKEGT